LIGLYLFTPVLRPLIWKASDRELLYYIGLWILAVPGLTIIQEFTPFRSGFELQLATGYVGYYLLGHVLGGIEFSSRRLLLFSLLLLAGFIVTFLVFYMDIPPQDNEAVFRSYLSANIIFMAVSSLVFLRLAGQVIPPRMVPLLDMFSQASFGIYLMHSIVMRWLDQGWEALGMDTGAGSSLLVIPAVAAVGFLASFFITMVLRKIPVLKTIVP
jgi:surface polysaccharide O-acyltransferase-like enzyme